MNNDSTAKPLQPTLKTKRSLSPLWLLPIIALGLTAWLLAKTIHDAGKKIQIQFTNAQGLVAGRTTIRYHGLEVGVLREIRLSEDLQTIYAEADMYNEANKLLTQNVRFWLVKPTATLSGISGLDALVSGNYIAIQPGGEPTNKVNFVALDKAPTDIVGKDNLIISLTANELNGINVGSKIYYKQIPIGEVFDYQLNEKTKEILITANIQNKYRTLITEQSRFWNVSGVAAKIGLTGVDVQLESISSLLTGGIAVDSTGEGKPVDADHTFKLYRDLETAGRGIAISIELPDNSQIKANSAIKYRGIDIGQITNVVLSSDHSKIIATAAIQPDYTDMLNTKTSFLIQEGKLSLTGAKNLGNFLTGNYLTIKPGDGLVSRHFVAYRENQFNEQNRLSLPLKLVASQSFGLSAGTAIRYRGIQVGVISQVQLGKNEVEFDLLIDKKYSHLIRANNRFFITGSAKAELTDSGLNITVPPMSQLLSGSISFTSEGKAQINKSYPLYQSEALAELAIYHQKGSEQLTLLADTLPPISKGSPLLYRNLPVGSVFSYKLTSKGVEIIVSIEKQYKHLLSDNTVFWNRSGVEVEASLSGVSIKAAPLTSLLKGGIAFDELDGVSNKKGNDWILYPDMKTAQAFGREIEINAAQTYGLVKGAPVRFNGVDVGEITDVGVNLTTKKVKFSVRILPDYADKIARKDTQFWVSNDSLSLAALDNIGNLINKPLFVAPGKGKPSTHFTLGTKPKVQHTMTFVLQSGQKTSASVGTPILFRGITVGRVVNIELGDFADRVLLTIGIDKKFGYLVRDNSVFWNVSGVDFSLGFAGATVKAGTMDSILKGGIEFASPDDEPLGKIATETQSFTLHREGLPNWINSRKAIPKPLDAKDL